jgi:hypothetical protein
MLPKIDGGAPNVNYGPKKKRNQRKHGAASVRVYRNMPSVQAQIAIVLQACHD